MWVLYFQPIGKLPKIFQNHTGGIIFSKTAPNFTVLEGIFEIQFQIWFYFGPSNLYRDFFCKIEGDFKFKVNLFFLVRFILKVIFI